ncbi:LA2681 family HEPN domain-containing protein [Paenibacillus cellulosilyticus]|uniref:LA2681 family HEPN domain-containing protein n=1 Tax=Paenibacillus cellulosilyticus TaxID=375489 RepID=UPI001FE51812|nr:LA2681 family HEPN domain-containing protein [Paenibacillus cellulosilyticus]
MDRAILAYHGATSYANYIAIVHNGVMQYSEENNNEADFEFCIYLYRRSLEYFRAFREDGDLWDKADDEDIQYYSSYLQMLYVNYANDLNRCGRLLQSISQLKHGVASRFSMAVGNMATKLITYAQYDYDIGHSRIFFNEAYQLLRETLEGALHEDAKLVFLRQKVWLEENFPEDFLREPYNFEDISLGETSEEKNYRMWCLENTLFLNTLNDAFYYSLVAHDCIHLPDIVTDIHVGFKFHGLFNQLKQEYVSARFMIYDGLHNRGGHYSDRDVFMYNTLDYPIYGLNIEMVKCAFRSLYSLFDRIAFFINDYFELGIKGRDVSYKSIWERRKGGKGGYEYALDLKKAMSGADTYNLPLIGLYWLFKDVGKKEIKHDYLEPAIKQIVDIRHALEHRYFKLHDSMFVPCEEPALSDTLAKSVDIDVFKNTCMQLLRYSREAIILLVLAVHREERLRNEQRDIDKFVAPMFLDKFEDAWKQIF